MAPLPATTLVQFYPGNGRFHVDKLIDPDGAPADVLDIDLGFTVLGSVELPGWLSGKGEVRLAADEIGGQIDEIIGRVSFPIPGSNTVNDPPSMKYQWRINVSPRALPDVSNVYRLAVVFAFQTPGGGHTDIGAFYDLGTFLVV